MEPTSQSVQFSAPVKFLYWGEMKGGGSLGKKVFVCNLIIVELGGRWELSFIRAHQSYYPLLDKNWLSMWSQTL